MILLDLPYVSGFLLQTIRQNNFPVFEPSGPLHFDSGSESFCLTEAEVIAYARGNKDLRIYTNSENSINWIINNLGFTDLPRVVTLFKDKVAFRKLTQPLFPGLYFREVALENIFDLSITAIPKPFVIKPSVGFFSLGVYTVNNDRDWEEIKNRIRADIHDVKELYPTEVLNTNTFIIEQYITGTEYAFDAYYDEKGETVILNILKHVFSSGDDVSDRVYLTSTAVIRENFMRFNDFLKQIGNLVKLKNFPLHVEVRVDDNGNLVPIEINPLRFGGWCTTADTTWYAYGINSYEYFLNNLKPDWDKILETNDSTIFSLIVLNNSTGVKGIDIESFDYEKLLARFHKPLELRRIDFTAFPLFGFLFTETASDNYCELERILTSDLKEYITTRQ